MKIGYFPNIKSILRDSTIRQAQVASRFKVRAVKRTAIESSTLVIDSHTQKDLEIFEAQGEGKNLFDLYNLTTTQGGSQILRQRMERPFADTDSILGVQQSIAYILEHRSFLTSISFWITGRVERYQRDPLMFVTQKSRIGFALGAAMLKLFDSHHFFRIYRGVQFTCLFVQSLREFLIKAEIHPAQGELASICESIREILCEPMFLRVPDHELRGSSFLKILRLDQTFRIYQREQVRELLRLTYEIDALISMADATSKHSYVIPAVLNGPTRIHAKGLVHPQVKEAVANAVQLDQENRLLFLTGPNMAGKTTYLRAIATALYLGHLGMGVPAASFAFTPIDRLFSSISISDNVHSGTSYFLAEVLRIKAIASAIAEGHKVVAILDEPFKGTNVKDSLEASLALIERLESKFNCLFLYSSHLIEIVEMVTPSHKIVNCHFEANESFGNLQFDYKLKPGVSSQRLGMRVLTEAGVFALLDSQANTRSW